MNNYDFTSLNDKEFEALATDLLSEEYDVKVERFKPGTDKGVDGRWFSPDRGEVIVQCKHWLKTGLSGLLKHLRKSERPKVDQLSPARYILVTSVPLSRKNKKDIVAIFHPHIVSETDIWGPEDLNDALGRHGVVERRHYKLWLSSTSTLGMLLNHAILGRSRAELKSMHEGAALYAVTSDHDLAWRHLNERRVLVLTGEPGIGKTTLARQLILEHVAAGFELVVIEESISEAEAVFVDDADQIFYFDDFLGRTFLEALKTKQDSHISAFIRRVSKDPRKRFVLTSRTNILNQGAVLSDLFAGPHVTQSTYQIEIRNLRKFDRAQILYNHIWHSILPPAYIDEIYKKARYHEVIEHRNFNPRLIAFILDNDKVAGILPKAYWSFVRRTLDNPQDVWSHFFASQLNQDCRDLAYISVLNGGRIQEDELREAFFHLPSKNHPNSGLTYHEFQIGLRHSVGSVLNRNFGSGVAYYTLFNPSIADYVLRYLSHSNLWEYYYPRIRTLSALSELEQLRTQEFFGTDTYSRVLRAIASVEAVRKEKRDRYSLRVARLCARESTVEREFSELIQFWIEKPDSDVVLSNTEDYIGLLADSRGVVDEATIVQHANTIHDQLDAIYLPWDEPSLVSGLLEMLQDVGLSDEHSELRERLIDEWSDRIEEIIDQEGILAEYMDLDDSYAASDDVRYFVLTRFTELGITLTPSELDRICWGISASEIISENIARALREERQAGSWRRIAEEEPDDIDAIDDLFDRTGR